MTHLDRSHVATTRDRVAEQAISTIGLIGHPVEHSLSPAMQNAAFEQLGLPYHYVLLPTPPGELSERVRYCVEGGLAGWNVTVPNKERMVSYLDSMSDEVRATGACNTVRVEGGRLHGFNTDPVGFLRGLEDAGGIAPRSRAVLMGAGGAARAVAWTLLHDGHMVTTLSRRPSQAYLLAKELSAGASLPAMHGTLDGPTLTKVLQGARLLVNCTSAGMSPHNQETPLPDGVDLAESLLVYDLVYRPRPTRLVQEAQVAGCRTQDGLAMLVHQGAAAFEIWTGTQAPVETMRRVCLDTFDTLDDRK